MITTQEWQARGRLTSLLGYDIFTMDEGEAKSGTILLIHGFPTSSWDWAPMWESLTNNYRILALDMLGFGFSSKPAKHTYSIMEQADITEAYVRSLGLTDYHVLAHDYGDTVAQELLARQNSRQGEGRWQSLCLLNGGLFPETHHALPIQKLLLSPIGPLVNTLSNKARFTASMSRTFGPNTKPSPEEIDAFWSLINHNNGRHNFHKLITYMTDRKNNRDRWVNALRQTSIPIALINGSVDPVSGAHMIQRYKEVVGEPAYLAQLDNIGHYPQVEAPDDVSRHYLKFLGAL